MLNERLGDDAGHNHNMDIPTRILTTLAYPIYFLAAAWDFLASKINKSEVNELALAVMPSKKQPPVNFNEFLDKQRGIKRKHSISLPADAQHPSKEWQAEHTVSLIEKYQRKHLASVSMGHELAKAKITQLNILKEKVREPNSGENLAQTLAAAKNEPLYNQHRLFNREHKTNTQEFIERLPKLVNARN
jgi:hypothetical protein